MIQLGHVDGGGMDRMAQLRAGHITHYMALAKMAAANSDRRHGHHPSSDGEPMCLGVLQIPPIIGYPCATIRLPTPAALIRWPLRRSPGRFRNTLSQESKGPKYP